MDQKVLLRLGDTGGGGGGGGAGALCRLILLRYIIDNVYTVL